MIRRDQSPDCSNVRIRSDILSFSHALLEMIADLQSERMDEQRAQLPGLVSRRGQPATTAASAAAAAAAVSNVSQNNLIFSPYTAICTAIPNTLLFCHCWVEQTSPMDDAFLDMLMRCQVKCALSFCLCVSLFCMTVMSVVRSCSFFVRDFTRITQRIFTCAEFAPGGPAIRAAASERHNGRREHGSASRHGVGRPGSLEHWRHRAGRGFLLADYARAGRPDGRPAGGGKCDG